MARARTTVPRKPRGRPLDGILALDKPQGLTSNAALQRVKRAFDARKAGHTGSLDPLATGMLPICFGRGTKLSGYLLDADKSYQVEARLGAKTETGDSDGEVTAESAVPALELAPARALVAERFTGEIEQIPPMYSALKHQGKRLYELARAGEEVVREPRRITIHELRLEQLSEDGMHLTVRCSKGTYVRTLVEDLAEALGTLAHVTALRRTQVGPFEAEEMVDMATIEGLAEAGDREGLDALLLPLDRALASWPAVDLDGDSAWYLKQGQPVMVPGAPTEGWLRLYAPEQAFLGVGEVLPDGRIAPRRLLA